MVIPPIVPAVERDPIVRFMAVPVAGFKLRIPDQVGLVPENFTVDVPEVTVTVILFEPDNVPA